MVANVVCFITIIYGNFHLIQQVTIGRHTNKEHKPYSGKPFGPHLFLQWFTGLLKDLENDEEHSDVFGYLFDKGQLSSYDGVHS